MARKNYSLLFLMIYFLNLFEIGKINASFHKGMLFKYDGPTWEKEPVLEEETKEDGKLNWQKMRIDPVYVKDPEGKQFEPATWLNEEDWQYVKKITDKTLEMVTEMITGVRRISTPIYAPRRCETADGTLTGKAKECRVSLGEKCTRRGFCYDLDVPEKYSGTCTHNSKEVYKEGSGSSSDLLLFVSVEQLEELANAIPCHNLPKDQTGRPVVGRIIIDYDIIKNRKPINQLKNILLHELFHIILYPLVGVDFRDVNNSYDTYKEATYVFEPRKWISPEGVYDRRAVYLKLPSVVKYVREHFNCPDLTGAELSNTSKSFETNYFYYAHFDNRLFPDALMAPVYSVGNTISKLEVAVAIDSGWYEVNQSVGRDLTLTKGKGCDFARMSCHEYMKTVDYKPEAIYPYCQRSAKHKWMCSLDHGQLVTCHGADTDKDVELEYQLHNGLFYYSGSRISEYFNHCPLIVTPGYLTEGASPFCREDEDAELRELGASGGHGNSMCMKALRLKSKKSKGCPEIDRSYSGVCVQRNCTEDGFKFSFGGQHFFCPKDGGDTMVEIDTTINGCKVSAKFCCPNYDVCLEGIKYNSSLMKLGRCCCNKFGKSVLLLLISITFSLLH